MTFDAPTITAITALIAVVANIFLTFDARRRGIRTELTVANEVLPTLKHVVALTNGQSEKLNDVHEKLGFEKGKADEKRNPSI